MTSDAAPPKPVTNEVIPNVPRSARDTISGTIRVSVRTIVAQDGAVVGAMTETAGPSRYFERLALEAARKWTFAPSESPEQRIMLVKFNFRRSGTTASASPVQPAP
ncbi:MAG TPA: energy transducer TonB [Steroidobacteraceae bacterium]|nr:energy transducer TonB [Steroidobacteraceae bacterium]